MARTDVDIVEAQHTRRREQGLGSDRLQEHLLTEEDAVPVEERDVEAAGVRSDQPRLARVPDAPRLAVEGVQHHAAPPEVRQPLGLDLVREAHPHDDVRVGQDAAVRAELDAFGEAGDHLAEPGPERQGREPHTRQQEEEPAGHQEHRHGPDSRQPDQVPRGHGLARRAGGRRRRLADDVLEERDPAQEPHEGDEREQEAHAERRARGRHQHEEGEERHGPRVPHGLERRELVQGEEEQEAHQRVENALREIRHVHDRRERRHGHHVASAPEPPRRAHAALGEPRPHEQDGHEKDSAPPEELAEIEREEAVHHQEVHGDPEGERERHQLASSAMRISRSPASTGAGSSAGRPGGA